MSATPMRRALSVQQPYAGLIVAGIKDVENRTWGTAYRGELVIHAGKARLEENFDCLDDLTDEDQAKLATAGYAKVRDLGFGALVGVVDLVDVVQGHPSRWANPEPGTFHWVMRPIEVFKKQVPFRGSLGLFGVPA